MNLLLLFSPQALMGLLGVVLGLRTLNASRPLVLSNRLYLLAIVACTVPAAVASFVDRPEGPSFPYSLVGTGLILATGVLLWIVMPQYMVLAATETQLDAAMADTLDRLGKPFEETREGLRLTAEDAMLKVRMGVQDFWSLSVSPRSRRALLVTVATGVRHYFRERAERGSKSGGYVFLVLGILFLLLTAIEALTISV